MRTKERLIEVLNSVNSYAKGMSFGDFYSRLHAEFRVGGEQ